MHFYSPAALWIVLNLRKLRVKIFGVYIIAIKDY